MKADRRLCSAFVKGTVLSLALAFARSALAQDDHSSTRHQDERATMLYVWAGDPARVAPDFLAVIDFDEKSSHYGKVIGTVRVPPPGNAGNEAHHCHRSADKKILGCGGLLSLLRGQNSIFFFDVSGARHPTFLFSTSGSTSSITDDFLPMEPGGFLITQMGSATGEEPGRVLEFDRKLNLVEEWPVRPPRADFNPHGISARPDLNLMVNSDFMLPASSLDIIPGDPVLRGAIRVWNLEDRKIIRTVRIPDAMGTMDVKLIPGDPQGGPLRQACLTDWRTWWTQGTEPRRWCSTARISFPTLRSRSEGGMRQLLAMPKSGDRLLFASFQAGQVGMLDVRNSELPVQTGIVNLGLNAGPHVIALTDDDQRLVVVDYFLNKDDFGKIHFEGDHHVRVVKVFKDHLELDSRFDVDFNRAFPGGPARPHGVAMK